MMQFSSVEEIYQALDKTRGVLIESVSQLDEKQANFRPDAEKWTAAMIVEHLAKTEVGLVRVVEKLLGKAEAENATSNGRFETPISLTEKAEQARNQRFQAPAMIVPEGAASIAESLQELEKSRQILKEMRSRIEAVDCTKVEYPHPAFGMLNLYEWLGFIGLHEMRHLGQIKNLLAAQKETVQ